MSNDNGYEKNSNYLLKFFSLLYKMINSNFHYGHIIYTRMTHKESEECTPTSVPVPTPQNSLVEESSLHLSPLKKQPGNYIDKVASFYCSICSEQRIDKCPCLTFVLTIIVRTFEICRASHVIKNLKYSCAEIRATLWT